MSGVELCQSFALVQRSLVPVCPVGGAHRHVVQQDPARYRFGGFLHGLCRRASAVATLGKRCSNGHAVSLADSSAETRTTTTRL